MKITIKRRRHAEDCSGWTTLFHSQLTRGQPPGGIWRAETEAAPNQLGDFDADGAWAIADLDTFAAAILADSTDLTFDVEQKGLVELEDQTHWVHQTWIGHTNLDGEFDSKDMTEAFGDVGYEARPRTVVSAVSEPS